MTWFEKRLACQLLHQSKLWEFSRFAILSTHISKTGFSCFIKNRNFRRLQKFVCEKANFFFCGKRQLEKLNHKEIV